MMTVAMAMTTNIANASEPDRTGTGRIGIVE